MSLVLVTILYFSVLILIDAKEDYFRNSEAANIIQNSSDGSFPKNIWLAWFQGWSNAPELVKRVRDSWKLHNPGWNIVLLDEKNLNTYVKIPLPSNAKAAAKSDIIRIYLLKQYGGVWADATMVCFWPLDMWIHDALVPEKFWMYHGRDSGRGPASWFIISYPSTYIINTWYTKVIEYWTLHTKEYDYFWMDQQFASLCLHDPEFLTRWKQVPYKFADTETGPHALAGTQKVFSYDPILLAKIKMNLPFAMKLSHHYKKLKRQANCREVMKMALTNIHNNISFIPEISPNFTAASFM